MKKTLGILFLVFAAIVATIYSPWGRETIRELIVQKLAKAGVHVEIEDFQGTFPYHVHLKGLTVETPTLTLQAERLDVKLSLLRLMRQQLGIASLDGEGITWSSHGSSKIAPPPFPIHVGKFHLARVQVPELSLEGSVKIGRHKSMADVFVQYGTLPATEVAAKADFLSNGELEIEFKTLDVQGIVDTQGNFELKASDWNAQGQIADKLRGTVQGLVFGRYEVAKTDSGFDIAVNQFYYESLFVEQFLLHIEPSLFSFSAKAPSLDMSGNGTWNLGKATVEQWSGTFTDTPFHLTTPVTIAFSPFEFEPVNLAVAEGSAFVKMGEVKLVHIPLQFVSPSINGWADLDGKWVKKNGQFKLLIEETTIGSRGEFEGSIDGEEIKLQGHASLGNKPLLLIDVAKNKKGHLEGEIAFEGRIEDLLDFADFGSSRVEGDGKCHFTLGGTLAKPELKGSAYLQNGLYQNYYTGTEITNIEANFLAKTDKLIMTSFKGDNVTAKGELLLSALYPFTIDAEFSDFTCVAIDLITAKTKGSLHISGNLEGALATGHLEMIDTLLTIPDHIPKHLPELQVVYRNPIKPIASLDKSTKTPYPLKLDLHVNAPQSVWIRGRGLDSEWKGHFDLGGTYTSLQAKGTLELVSGDFVFSSRSFKLTEGALSLSGKEHEMPYLNIVGSTELKGVEIVARMHGPLNSPQLTFQSVPPLPLGSIMSYLLFGQDLSEISGFQALQLASSVAALMGQGPDVMESTRRSLGVDRLRVITSAKASGEGENVALEVGKYVADGVLVSFSQGTEENSSNISVEVELKGGFVFQVETLQEQEQGRFTLKWKLNY